MIHYQHCTVSGQVSRQDLLYEILTTYTRLKEKCDEIQLIWTPAHVDILGNERVDKLAKQTIKKENIEVNIKMSKSEGKNIVWKVAVREGQRKIKEDICMTFKIKMIHGGTGEKK